MNNAENMRNLMKLLENTIDVETRSFPLDAILSITTGRMLTSYHEIQELMEFVLGKPTLSDEMPTGTQRDYLAIGKEVSDILISQHPFLADIDASMVGGGNYKQWLASMVQQYGEYLPVRPRQQSMDMY